MILVLQLLSTLSQVSVTLLQISGHNGNKNCSENFREQLNITVSQTWGISVCPVGKHEVHGRGNNKRTSQKRSVSRRRSQMTLLFLPSLFCVLLVTVRCYLHQRLKDGMSIHCIARRPVSLPAQSQEWGRNTMTWPLEKTDTQRSAAGPTSAPLWGGKRSMARKITSTCQKLNWRRPKRLILVTSM